MTKLMEWLSAAAVFLGIWTVMLKNPMDSIIFAENRLAVLLLPVLLVGLFGVYAASVVTYNVLTFNNCEKAAEELQMEIKLAKEDLVKKGFVFN